jgi:hypothetical protein
MNAPFIRPETVDWEAGLDPNATPAYREQRNPATFRALQHPTMQELRAAPDLEFRLYCAPSTDAYKTIPASGTYDVFAEVPAGAWIIGLSAMSTRAEGFLAQITLPMTGASVFSQPVTSKDLQSARPLYLPRPQGVPGGGPVRMRLINLSGSPNLCQLVMWVIQPL